MALIPGMTRRKLLRLHSVRLNIAAIAVSSVYLVVDGLNTYWFAAADHMNPLPFIAIGIALKGAAIVARRVYQPELNDDE